mmetsp:Transcript_23959/g.53344  ORF Transcript_23959/g.53344 Transcript_23959/m.53344 type:complete len:119 (-) Transcript_23959:1457-1813(-)
MERRFIQVVNSQKQISKYIDFALVMIQMERQLQLNIRLISLLNIRLDSQRQPIRVQTTQHSASKTRRKRLVHGLGKKVKGPEKGSVRKKLKRAAKKEFGQSVQKRAVPLESVNASWKA